MTCATAFRTWSPWKWPKRSLIALSPSRSIISNPNRRPDRVDRWISRSTAAKKNARLKRPVSESIVERRMAASRERRCSRAMYDATNVSISIATMFTVTSAVPGPVRGTPLRSIDTAIT